MTYGKSTYREVLDSVISGLEGYPQLMAIPLSKLICWINDAQEKITQLVHVYDEWTLTLQANKYKYFFQDRPPITNATNATPIVITAAGHGLTEHDWVTITEVQGNTAANGTFRVKNVTTDTFALTQAVRITEVFNTTPIRVRADDHPFVTGDIITIDGVKGTTAANGTFTITVVDKDYFTLDNSVGNGNYEGGGVAAKDVAGNGSFTRGGKFWRSDEIPTFFADFKRGRRVLGKSIIRLVYPTSVSEMLKHESYDSVSTYPISLTIPPDWNTPSFMTILNDLGVRYLKLYPTPTNDNELLTLYGRVLFIPSSYANAQPEDYIFLKGYDSAIKYYLTARLYGWLKEFDREDKFDKYFFQELMNIDANKDVNVGMEISYS